MPERARGWAMAVGTEQPPSARPGERCKCQGVSCPEPSTFLQAPDLAYTPKIEIFHCCNRKTPFASSDASFRADHYGVLRSRLLQRVVALLQVNVWSASAGGHRVSGPHPPCGCMEHWVGTPTWEATACASTGAPKSCIPPPHLRPGIIHRRTGVNWGFQGVFPRLEAVKTAELCLLHRHSQV